MIHEVVNQRMRDVKTAGGADRMGTSCSGGRDLLSIIVKENANFKGSENKLSEENIVNQVS